MAYATSTLFIGYCGAEEVSAVMEKVQINQALSTQLTQSEFAPGLCSVIEPTPYVSLEEIMTGTSDNDDHIDHNEMALDALRAKIDHAFAFAHHYNLPIPRFHQLTISDTK